MENNQKGFYIKLLVVIIILVIGGFYFYSRNSSKSSSGSKIENQAEQVTNATTTLSHNKKEGDVSGNISSQNSKVPSDAVKISDIASLAILSLPTLLYGDNDIIRISFQGEALIGPMYLYLQSVSSRQVVATQIIEKGSFKQTGITSANFDLQKTKVQSEIKPGKYAVTVCDRGRKTDLCSSSNEIQIDAVGTSIDSLEPTLIFRGSNVVVYGSGFNENSMIIIDGARGSSLKPKFLSTNKISFVMPLNISLVKHIIQVTGNKNLALLSNSFSFNVFSQDSTLLISELSSGFGRVGETMTLFGRGFIVKEPYSKVELLKNGKVVVTLNPILKNSSAISTDGKTLQFFIDETFANLDNGDYMLRVSNGSVRSNEMEFAFIK